MSLYDAIRAELPALRLEAEARMTSRATIRRFDPDDPTVVDGIESQGWATIHADLRCRIAGNERGGAGSQTRTVGESEVQLATRVLHVPAGTAGIADGDLVEITAGENTGAVFEVLEAGWQDQATARRLPVAEAQRPEEW